VHSRARSPYRGNEIVARSRQSLMMPAARNFPVNGAALRLSGRGGGQPVFVQFGCGLPIVWSVGGEQEEQQCVLS
jgi:hypothetical protein